MKRKYKIQFTTLECQRYAFIEQLLAHRSLHNDAPSYLADLIVPPAVASRPTRAELRLESHGRLILSFIIILIIIIIVRLLTF